MIEKITGASYYEYVHNNILDKVDMIQSGFFSMDEINENVAEGYTEKSASQASLQIEFIVV